MKRFAALALLTLVACQPNVDNDGSAGSTTTIGTSGSVTTTGSSSGSTGVGTSGASTAATTGTTSGTHGATTAGTTTSGTTTGTQGASGATTGGTGTGGTSTGSGTTSGSACVGNEFQTCTSSQSCTCGLVCVVDAAFVNAFTESTESVCERPCHTSDDCLNAASYCTLTPPVYEDGGEDDGIDAGVDAGWDAGVDAGDEAGLDAGEDAGIDAGLGNPDAGPDAGTEDAGLEDAGDSGLEDAGLADAGALDAGPTGTCAVLQCGNAEAGDACPVPIVDADAGTVATGLGTCVPQSNTLNADEETVLICLPPGTATSCDMSGDENPLLSGGNSIFSLGGTLKIGEPQPRDPATLCVAGDGCVDGGCATLCVPGETVCADAGAIVCVSEDANDTSWGFCLPCGSSGSDGGSASTCIQDSDCCEQNCSSGSGLSFTMTCAPAGQ